MARTATAKDGFVTISVPLKMTQEQYNTLDAFLRGERKREGTNTAANEKDNAKYAKYSAILEAEIEDNWDEIEAGAVGHFVVAADKLADLTPEQIAAKIAAKKKRLGNTETSLAELEARLNAMSGGVNPTG